MPDFTPVITFSWPLLMPIGGEPHNSLLKLLQVELNTNTIFIPFHRIGEAHGHLTLNQSLTGNLLLAGVAFISLVNPGLAPLINANTTGNQITEAN
jgi:hypothetical protein